MPTGKSKTRIANGRLSKSTKPFIQRWMAFVIVGVIALVGIFVVWRSFASPLPQEVINNVQVQVLPDGRAKVTESSLGYERIFNQIDTARALSDQNYYNELMQKVLDDLQKLYDQKHPDAPPPTPAPTPAPAPSTNPIQPAPSSGSGQNSGGSDSSSSSTGSVKAPDQPTNNNNGGTNISSTNKTQESLSSSYYDIQNPETLPTLNGTMDFSFNPPADNRSNVVGVYIDNKLNQYFEPKTNKFSIDTTRLSNDKHRLDVLIYDKDQKELARYVYVFNVKNKLNFLHSIYNSISQPFVNIFGP